MRICWAQKMIMPTYKRAFMVLTLYCRHKRLTIWNTTFSIKIIAMSVKRKFWTFVSENKKEVFKHDAPWCILEGGPLC